MKLSLLPKDYVPDSFQQQLQEALSKKMWEKTGTVTKIHGHHAPPAKMNATTLQQLIEMVEADVIKEILKNFPCRSFEHELILPFLYWM